MSTEKPQSGAASWFRAVGDRFLNVHFVVTFTLIAFWMWALREPLGALGELYPKLASAPADSRLIEAIGRIEESAATVSALFTTVIGVVLRFYFGHRGVETEENALRSSEEMKEEIVDDYAESQDALTSQINFLTRDLDLRDNALRQALEIIHDRVGEEFTIDEGSALDKLLLSEDGEDDDEFAEGLDEE